MGGLTLGVKALQTGLYFLLFLASAVILALYSYFLAIQHNHDVDYSNRQRAVEGISGAGVLYSILAIIFTCFLGGKSFFAFLGIALDILFVGGFIAIAVLTDDGAKSCATDTVYTPLGSGNPDDHPSAGGEQYSISYHTACIMNRVAFIVSIIGAGLFLLAALVQLWLGRRHQRDKRYGPSPSNGYTAGVGHQPRRRFPFGRKRGVATTRDVEPGVVGTNGVGHNHRHSHGTATTDSYVGHKAETNDGFVPVNGPMGHPHGTGVNPYGYENERSHAV